MGPIEMDTQCERDASLVSCAVGGHTDVITCQWLAAKQRGGWVVGNNFIYR